MEALFAIASSHILFCICVVVLCAKMLIHIYQNYSLKKFPIYENTIFYLLTGLIGEYLLSLLLQLIA
jgi:hypothetical protein